MVPERESGFKYTEIDLVDQSEAEGKERKSRERHSGPGNAVSTIGSKCPK